MKVKLEPLFGRLPAATDNLEVVGPFDRRFEERDWATVWPASGVVRWANGAIENEVLWVTEAASGSMEAMKAGMGKQLAQCGDFNSKWSWLPRKRRGRFFNVSLFWSFGYYHWICDVLTRFHNVLPGLTADVQVIVPADATAWQSRSLELIGLPRNSWLPYSGKRPWKVEQLIYASPTAMTGDHEQQSLHWVRDTIWQRCLGGPPARAGRRKLYLTRKNTWSRNVVNEAELLPRLQERGFEMVDCGTLSFDEQVRLFSEAACVAGPHGAALTNILWSPPGIKVFEIFEPDAVRRCYWSMCQTLGHQHACGIGQPVPQAEKEANIRVPVKEFIGALESIGL